MMTVKKLKKLLEKYDDKTEVVIDFDHGMGYYTVEDVESVVLHYMKDGKEINEPMVNLVSSNEA